MRSPVAGAQGYARFRKLPSFDTSVVVKLRPPSVLRAATSAPVEVIAYVTITVFLFVTVIHGLSYDVVAPPVEISSGEPNDVVPAGAFATYTCMSNGLPP